VSEQTPTREQILALDRAHVWHPYTTAERALCEPPLVIAEVHGSTLVDVSGKTYIDGNSSWWVSALGHRHPRLLRVLKEQAEILPHVAFAGITHAPGALLADELVRAAPRGSGKDPILNRVFYTDNGSTAVEAAVKVAAQFWYQNGSPRKNRFIALEGAFHGDTLGATSLGGVELFKRPFGPLLFESIRVAFPEAETTDADTAFARAFETIETMLRTKSEEVAAVVVEPLVQGAMGMRMYSASFLRELRRMCDAHNTLLIFDEVFTGYGRTGTMWAADRAGCVPDIMCLGKAFASLLPMGAILVSEALYQGFSGSSDRAFFYGHTFCGHPLGAALAREVLAIYRDEKIIEYAAPKARMIERAMTSLGALSGVSHPRSLGMIGAVDLGSGAYQGKAGWQVYKEALKRGAYLRPLGDTVYVCPPLNIPGDELGALLGILHESVQAALRSS
jgi:adenosylmethionine---8-amino-7-oxononanoate aminotransferase